MFNLAHFHFRIDHYVVGSNFLPTSCKTKIPNRTLAQLSVLAVPQVQMGCLISSYFVYVFIPLYIHPLYEIQDHSATLPPAVFMLQAAGNHGIAWSVCCGGCFGTINCNPMTILHGTTEQVVTEACVFPQKCSHESCYTLVNPGRMLYQAWSTKNA